MVYISTYIISDIHGDAFHFWNLYKRLKIDPVSDKLIINGDVLDRNYGSLKLFFELIDLKNKYPNNICILKGNHERFAEIYLLGQLSEKLYSTYGGDTTIKDIKSLNNTEKSELLADIRSLPIYTTITSEKRGQIAITHAGLDMNHIVETENGSIDVIKSIEYGVSWNQTRFLICTDLFYGPAWIIKKLNMPLIVGHVPVIFLEPQLPVIYERCDTLICVDCGAGYRNQNGRLGILRIEDEQAFYS